MDGPYYWTLGEHNGYKAVQVTNENLTDNDEEKETQLFYFTSGDNTNEFKIYTYDGLNIDYLPGSTRDSWNNGNLTPDGTYNFIQYDTESSGNFQILKSDNAGYYGISYNGILMNDRGTGNGSAANMKWVINTYANNNLDDNGSRYRFILEEEDVAPSGIEFVSDSSQARAMTRDELINEEGLRIYGYDGRYVPDIKNAPNGIYIVITKDNESYKVILK